MYTASVKISLNNCNGPEISGKENMLMKPYHSVLIFSLLATTLTNTFKLKIYHQETFDVFQ